MTCKLRALGLALMTVFALSAVSTSSASAEVLFHSNTAKTFGTVSQIGTNTFDTEIGNFKCKVVGGTASITGSTASSITVNPTFKECTAFGLEMAFDMNGCDYNITSSGIFHIDCPTTAGGVTDEIRITANPTGVVCTLGIPEQTMAATYNTEGVSPTRDVKMTPNPTSPLKYTVTYPKGETEGKCGKAGAHTDGKYTGSTTIKGFKDAAHTEVADVWVE